MWCFSDFVVVFVEDIGFVMIICWCFGWECFFVVVNVVFIKERLVY